MLPFSSSFISLHLKPNLVIRIQHRGCYWCELNTSVWTAAFQSWITYLNMNQMVIPLVGIIISISYWLVCVLWLQRDSGGRRQTNQGWLISVRKHNPPLGFLSPAFWVWRILSYTPSEFSRRVLLVWITWKETNILFTFAFIFHISKTGIPHKAESSLRLVAGCFYPGKALKNKLLLQDTSGRGCLIAFLKAKIRR